MPLVPYGFSLREVYVIISYTVNDDTTDTIAQLPYECTQVEQFSLVYDTYIWQLSCHIIQYPVMPHMIRGMIHIMMRR